MKSHDPKSALRERKALVLARFSLRDAQAMCGHDVPCFEAPELSEPCPACGSIDLAWLVPAVLSGQYSRVDRAEQAQRLSCRHCCFNGDAVAYVMANYNISYTDFALDRIEEWLAGEGTLKAFKSEPAAPPQKMAFRGSPRRRRKALAGKRGVK